MRRPRIAVPEINQNVSNYLHALRAGGMSPVLISVQREQIENQYQNEYMDYADFNIRGYDGLLLPGGWDVNPARYHQENRGSLEIRDDLDKLQMEVLDAFVAAKKPVLGICRGHQLINVYFGGTLIQHLDTSFRHFHGKDEGDKVHGFQISDHCWLSQMYGESCRINSAHHQAVDLPGRGLIVDGRCTEDLTVEAMHHESLPVYGLQWHPERMCLAYARPDFADGFPVFAFFSRLCGGTPENFMEKNAAEEMSERMGI